MTSVRQNFNPDQFNFTKIDPGKELVLELRGRAANETSAKFSQSPKRDLLLVESTF